PAGARGACRLTEHLKRQNRGCSRCPDFGFDLFFGLGPRFRLTQPVEQSSENATRWVSEQEISWEWGLKTLLAGRRERLMPDEVRDRIAASGA
ncbi:hypothetical protein VB145_21695, partial [Xanthomonas arboricola]|nr:hypothetical protein [Xanthomonas arboricola]